MSDTTTTATTTASQAAAANATAVSLINAYAKPMIQPVGAPVVLDGSQLGMVPIYGRITPRQVGLLRRLYVRVEVDFTIDGTAQITRSPFGPAALLNNVQFTDLNNNKRIDTDGIHLAMLASCRQRQPAGSAFMTDSPLGFGNIVQGAIAYPMPTAAGTYTVSMTYEVPLAYQDGDYRGAIYTGVSNATTVLQTQINPLIFAPVGSGQTANSVYTYSGNRPTVGAIRIYPFQDYLDQLPTSQNKVILPTQSMGTVYQLIKSTSTGMTPNSEFRIDFANLRTYMSLFTVFNNGDILNPSTDLDNIKIEAANMYQFFNADMKLISYRNRCSLGEDLPAGVQYFPFRQQPINTSMYGNVGIAFTANTVNTGAKIDTYSEFFSDTLTLGASQIGS